MTPPTPAPPTVLVIDDHEPMRRIVAAVLEPTGVRVREASTGAAGVAQAPEADVILLDLCLGADRGDAWLPALRAAAPNARICCFSGSVRPGEERALLEAGFDRVIRKDLDPTGLRDEIDAARAPDTSPRPATGIEAQLAVVTAFVEAMAAQRDPEVELQTVLPMCLDRARYPASWLRVFPTECHDGRSYGTWPDAEPLTEALTDPAVLARLRTLDGPAVLDAAPPAADPLAVLWRAAGAVPCAVVPVGYRDRNRGVLLVRPGPDRGAEWTLLARIVAAQIAHGLSIAETLAHHHHAVVALDRARRDLRGALQAAPMCVMVHRDGILLDANAALADALRVGPPDRLAGYALSDLHEPREEVSAWLRGTGVSATTLDTTWRTADGATVVLELSPAVPIAWGDEAATLVVAQDVTERRLLQRQVADLQRLDAIGRLTGGIAHDFNNLLTVVKTYAGFLQARFPPDSDGHDETWAVMDAAERGAQLVHQLLAFGRQQVLEVRAVNVAEVVTGLLPMLHRLLGADVEIRLEPHDPRLTAHADRGQLEQVLVNLAVNARDAMPGGGRLTVRISSATAAPNGTPGAFVVLTVADTGVGMGEDTLAHLFEPFFTTKPVGKGTGLGLPTVYGIVRQSDGHIVVDSAPGHGASFQVFLPRAKDAAPATTAARAEASDDDDVAGGTETILLVEDEDLLRQASARVLRAAGYRVHTAVDGLDALRCGEGVDVDLVVTDVVMPHMSGPELADRLVDRHGGVRVLYTSGYAADHRAGIDLAEGAFLPKPYSGTDLLQRVRQVIDAAPAARRTA